MFQRLATAVRRWRLSRQIKRSEGDLGLCRSFPEGHRLYEQAREVIPLLEAELSKLRREAQALAPPPPGPRR